MTLVSFSIPTYNRSTKTYNLVKEILSFQSNDIEVLVLDNASTDNTGEILSTIKDSRFKYFKNNISIMGPHNIIKSLTMASGTFTFLCLDKDFIKTEHLNKLINILKHKSDLSFGFCKLNLFSESIFQFYEKGFDSLFNMCYLSPHPTGMFYRTEYLINLKFLDKIYNNKNIFGFYPDIINAELSLMGSSIVINSPIFFTESRKECASTLSHTFKLNSDLFFTPNKRLETLFHYSNHICQNDTLTYYLKYQLLKKVFVNELNQATIGFKTILNDKEVCLHYYIKSREISKTELVKIYLRFNIGYLLKNNNPNIFYKIFIITHKVISDIKSILFKNLKSSETRSFL
jgi:glycosyltransferase involved in cell wall biosynthesis